MHHPLSPWQTQIKGSQPPPTEIAVEPFSGDLLNLQKVAGSGNSKGDFPLQTKGMGIRNSGANQQWIHSGWVRIESGSNWEIPSRFHTCQPTGVLFRMYHSSHPDACLLSQGCKDHTFQDVPGNTTWRDPAAPVFIHTLILTPYAFYVWKLNDYDSWLPVFDICLFKFVWEVDEICINQCRNAILEIQYGYIIISICYDSIYTYMYHIASHDRKSHPNEIYPTINKSCIVSISTKTSPTPWSQHIILHRRSLPRDWRF